MLKFLSFEEEISVFVAGGELRTDRSFYLAGVRFLTLHYAIERLGLRDAAGTAASGR